MLKVEKQSNCSNPQCHKKLEHPIIVYDHSKVPTVTYYACPYCLLECDPTTIHVPTKEKRMAEDENEINRKLSEKKNVLNCPKYLGYLSCRLKNSFIPYECLNCKKITKCAFPENKKTNEKSGAKYVEMIH
jgi:hypothetical protein